MIDVSPLEALREVASGARCGEFIALTPSFEVHVYLQEGRVAWATDSSHPFEFARYVRDHCLVEDETFRAVVEECQRNRLPLGETLVAWELVTLEQVRTALSHQLTLALNSLASVEAGSEGSTLFLERQWRKTYDERLTFEIATLLAPPAPPPEAPAPVLEVLPDPTPFELFDTVPGCISVEVIDTEGRMVDSVPVTDTLSRGFEDLSAASLEDGADFVALRTLGQCFMGVRSEGSGHRFWLELSGDSFYSQALTNLSNRKLVRQRVQSPQAQTPKKAPAFWKQGVIPEEGAREILQVLDYGPDVLAVLVLAEDGSVESAVGRPGIEFSRAKELVQRRMGILSHSPAVETPLANIGFQYLKMCSGESEVWCFGVLIAAPGTHSLWVITDRRATQGLGWGCLTALSRGVQQRWGRTS